MENNKQAAEVLTIAEEKVRLDEAVKRVLKVKIYLAMILKYCLKEFKDYSIEDIAEKYIEGDPEKIARGERADSSELIVGMNTESTSLNQHNINYDVLFYAYVPAYNDYVKLIINVEAQNQFYVKKPYPLLKRAFYYCSRLIAEQSGVEFENSDYSGINKVISIWICIDPPKALRGTAFRYNVKEEAFIGKTADFKEAVENYDLLEIVMLYLGETEAENSEIIKFLNTLLSDRMKAEEKKSILSGEFGIKMSEDSEVDSMCNFSEGVWRNGINEGKDNALIASVKNLMKNLRLSFEEAAKALGIPTAEWERYAKLVAAAE